MTKCLHRFPHLTTLAFIGRREAEFSVYNKECRSPLLPIPGRGDDDDIQFDGLDEERNKVNAAHPDIGTPMRLIQMLLRSET
jgi:hypothetical protein